MQLTRFQLSALRMLLKGEQPLSAFCDSPEGEKLCWSGLVGIRAPKTGIRATVALTDRGREVLAAA